MRLIKTVVGATALFLALAMPSFASAESILPPGNSAATQYTETFPTTGGNAVVNGNLAGEGKKGNGGKSPSPKQVLGAETTDTLESAGSEGETIVQLATEAAPQSADKNDRKAHKKSGKGEGNDKQGEGGAAGAGGTGGSGPSLAERSSGGSSALGEVLSQATASSSGTMGVFLPLAMILALVWAIVYAWRRRNPGQATS